MKQSKPSSSNREQNNGADGEANGPYRRSRERMLDAFARTWTLMTVELLQTILHPDTDKALGAVKFTELMIAALMIERTESRSPRFI